MTRRALMAGSLLVVTGCAGPAAPVDPPSVRLVDLRPQAVGLFEQRFLARVRLENPNPVPLRVRGLRVSLEIDGRPFGEGSRELDLELPPLGRRVVPVPLFVATGSLVRGVLEALRQGGFRYRLEGTVLVARAFGIRRLPFVHEGALLAPRVGPP